MANFAHATASGNADGSCCIGEHSDLIVKAEIFEDLLQTKTLCNTAHMPWSSASPDDKETVVWVLDQCLIV